MKKKLKTYFLGIIFSPALVFTIIFFSLWTGFKPLDQFTTTVNAQPICIPYAGGVPRLSGPPNWWDPSESEREYLPDIDDPRWEGALRIAYNEDEVAFRALHHTETNSLYLSWHVKIDPEEGPLANFLENYIYVGFRPDLGSMNTLQIQVTPYDNWRIERTAQYPYDIIVWDADYAIDPPTETSRDPDTDSHLSWIDDIRIWTKNTSDPYEWAIHMRVRTDSAGINLNETFSMFYEVYIGTHSGLITYKLPRDPNDENDSPPSLDRWVEFHIGDDGDTECARGVSIAKFDIGIWDPDTRDITHEIKITEPNIFIAKPLNETGDTIEAGCIKARFRIANWGSVPLATDPDPLWETISGPCVGGDGIGGLCTNNDSIPDNPGVDDKGEIEMTWSLGDCEAWNFMPEGTLCPVIDPPCVCNPDKRKRRHQCMLVELSSDCDIFLVMTASTEIWTLSMPLNLAGMRILTSRD